MTAAAPRSCRLSADDWNEWAATAPTTAVSPAESEHFHQRVGPRAGMTAIDLACGTGQWTQQLAAWGMAVTGYDFSDQALRQAEAEGLREGLAYALWDIVADPIPTELRPGTLDLVTCRYGLPYLEPGRLLTDVGRWLKPDGVFYAIVHVGADPERRNRTGWQVHDSSTGTAAFHQPMGLTDKQLTELGAGWVRREVHQLGHQQKAIVLSGYGRTPAPSSEPVEFRRLAGAIAATYP
ncbi:class I SAM-dependent methyltransferase [Streptomyces sp. NPDC050211]|uniref:class I SAM-dependent methyltransferase n=1 Tax=Streptomyces sp. NPDC050211 TaxID=3154932 RepID=UPI00342722D4